MDRQKRNGCFRRNQAGASLSEYGITVGLVSVLAIGAVVGLGHAVNDVFGTGSDYLEAANDVGSGDFETIEDALTGTVCQTETEGADTLDSLPPRVNCLYLLGGDDSVATNSTGDLIVYPGLGNDSVILNAQNATFVYEAGNDTYGSMGKNSVLDLGLFAMADVSYKTGALDPSSSKKGWVSYDIVTPGGTIRIEDGMTIEPGNNHGMAKVAFSDGQMSDTQIKQIVLDSQMTSGSTTIYGTSRDDVMVGSAGNDTVYLAEGDDAYTWVGGSEKIDASKGADQITFQGWNYGDVVFDIDKRDLFVTLGSDKVTLSSQARYMTSSPNALFAYFVFDDATLTWEDVAARAVADQEASGVDDYEGTGYADMMHPTAQNTKVNPGDGDDRIFYTSGDILIYGATSGFRQNPGDDTLVMDQYASSQVTAAIEGADVVLSTPDGTVTLQNQVMAAEGANAHLTIDHVIFSDTTWHEPEIRSAAGA